MADDFPAEIRQFVVDHISSVAQLEVLLLLHSSPTRNWAPCEVHAVLCTSVLMCAEHLADLQNRGLLVVVGPGPRFQYQPRTVELSAIVDALARIYAERRVALITLIYSKPVDSARSFADAFRLRKDK
jgi:hypothetical protein